MFRPPHWVFRNAPMTAESPTADHRDERGPFDIVGDVHGCADELIELL